MEIRSIPLDPRAKQLLLVSGMTDHEFNTLMANLEQFFSTDDNVLVLQMREGIEFEFIKVQSDDSN